MRKSRLKRFLYRNGFRFGRYEHFTSRLLFVFLLITLGLQYFEEYNLALKFMMADVLLWLMYWTCHRIEKFFHTRARK